MTKDNFYPFADSPLWQLQREYFMESGVNAWRKGEVPHYITSNPHMAVTYAQLIKAFILERDSSTPVYIIELGTGSGRFSYHLLKELDKLFRTHEETEAPFVYVMTDFVEDTLSFWESHPRLQAFFDRGMLDFALFDAEKDTAITLRKSGRILERGQVESPLICLANYFFDSIPQDLFYCNEGKLNAVAVELQGYDPSKKHSAIEQLKNIELNYTQHPLSQAPYPERSYNALLKKYQAHLENSYLLFPHIGLRCIDNLQAISKEGCVFITADKARHRLERWQNHPPPHIAQHGSFSLVANYHALKAHCEQSGGTAFFPQYASNSLTVGFLMYLNSDRRYPETQLAYQRHINDFGPDDYFVIKKHIEKGVGQLQLKDLFAYIRLSEFDARLFAQFLPRFHELIDEFTEDNRYTLLQTVARVWDGYYPLKEANDLPFEIGLILFEINFIEEAISFFNLSEQLYGPNEQVMYAKAVCYCKNENVSYAIYLLQQLLHAYPQHELAIELLAELQKLYPENEPLSQP